MNKTTLWLALVGVAVAVLVAVIVVRSGSDAPPPVEPGEKGVTPPAEPDTPVLPPPGPGPGPVVVKPKPKPKPVVEPQPVAKPSDPVVEPAEPVEDTEPEPVVDEEGEVKPPEALKEEAMAASLMSTMRTVRSQLEVYRKQHGDKYPTDLVRQMTMFTDADGNTSETQTPTFQFGPYLDQMPVNPYTGVDAVMTVEDAGQAFVPPADMTGGWWYNSAKGEFRCYVPAIVTAPDGKRVKDK